jgi:hypothetical protein
MEWSKQTPTVEGWYWIRSPLFDPQVVRVDDENGRLCACLSGVDRPGVQSEGLRKCEWGGPIAKPGERPLNRRQVECWEAMKAYDEGRPVWCDGVPMKEKILHSRKAVAWPLSGVFEIELEVAT